MSIAAAKATAKAAVVTAWTSGTDEASVTQAANDLVEAIAAMVLSASVTVPATGIVAPNGPCTGSAVGTLS